ncbi:uncharacterized protein LOC143905527 [Temnothorax americanus]|uniref:uncharacterized protein LOC143905527 n=1 Tax=Temnothorax americanus TaxID=1964332 RepID=UPI004067AA81
MQRPSAICRPVISEDISSQSTNLTASLSEFNNFEDNLSQSSETDLQPILFSSLPRDGSFTSEYSDSDSDTIMRGRPRGKNSPSKTKTKIPKIMKNNSLFPLTANKSSSDTLNNKMPLGSSENIPVPENASDVVNASHDSTHSKASIDTIVNKENIPPSYVMEVEEQIKINDNSNRGTKRPTQNLLPTSNKEPPDTGGSIKRYRSLRSIMPKRAPKAPSNLKVLYWNCRGVVHKKPDIDKLSEQYDIIFLAETLLRPYHFFSINGFDVVRLDNDTNKQGTALLVRNSINHFPINLDNVLSADHSIEAIGTKIFVNGNSTALFGIYRHPGAFCPPSTWHKLFNLADQFPQSLILGDLNAHHPHWGAPSPNPAGKIIIDLLDRFPFTLINPPTYTYIPPPGITPSLLDLAIASCSFAPFSTSMFFKTPSAATTAPLISLSMLKSNRITIKSNQIFSHKYKFTKEQFKALIHEFQLRAQEIEDRVLEIPDDAPLERYKTFISLLQDSLDKLSTPSPSSSLSSPTATDYSHPHSPPAPWWNPDCEAAVQARRKALKNYRKYPTPNNYYIYRSQVTDTRKILRSAKRKGWKDFCSSLDFMTPTPKIWKMIKKFRNRNWLLPLIHPRSTTLLPMRLCPPSPPPPACFSERIDLLALKDRYDYNNPFSWIDQPFIFSEFLNAINSTNNNSSPGFDRIDYKILKTLPPLYPGNQSFVILL